MPSFYEFCACVCEKKTHCFWVTDVELIDHQHLETTEDITVHLLTLEEVRGLLERNEIIQALHAAPLWKYMVEIIINTFIYHPLAKLI